MDFESDSDDTKLSPSQLANLSGMIDSLESHKAKVFELEDELKRRKEIVRKFEEEIIPEALRASNVSSFTTSDGLIVTVKDKVFASIPKDDEVRAAAFDWLRTNGHGDIIKREVRVAFGRGEDEDAERLRIILAELGRPYSDRQEVHFQTLGAFVREQLGRGNDLPFDLLGVRIVPKTDVKRRR